MKFPSVAIFLLLIPLQVAASNLQFITHSSQQQTFYDDGQLRGKPHAGRRAFYVELIRELMMVMDAPLVIDNYPLARGIRDVQSKDNIAFFNLTRTEERENTVKWVIPLLQTTSYFYENAGAPTGIKSLEDAKNIRAIGVLRGGIHESKLRSLGFDNLYPLESYPQVLAMLIKGRIDLTASSIEFYGLDADDPGLNELRKTGVKVFDSAGYLCFSLNVSDKVVSQWQNAYQQIKQSGKLERLTNNYLLPAATAS